MLNRNLISFVILLFAVFLFGNCGGDNTTDDGPGNGGNYELPKNFAYQGEVFAFSTPLMLSGETYNGSIGSEGIRVSYRNDNLIFIVPTSVSGKQEVKIDADGESIQFELQVDELPAINDPEAYIEDFSTAFNRDLSNFNQNKDSFIIDSVYGFENLQKDLPVWAEIEQDASDELSSMTTDQKMKLARVLSANEGWINGLNETIIGERLAFKKTTKNECKAIIKQGKEEQAKGNRFTALSKSIEAYWCAVNLQKLEDADTDIEKGITLIEETEDIWMLNTLTNFIGRKIEEITNEVNNLGSKPGVAEEVEDADSEKRAGVLSFVSGEAINLKARITFRTINKSDINSEGELGDFASFFSELINSYDRLIKVIDKPLVWRPGFSSETKTVEFNRFLSIDKSSISNSDIALVNTQYNGDLWEVIFGNDGFDQEPQFKFDLVYDDGHVQLKKTLDAKIANCRLGTFKDTRDGKVYQTVTVGDQTWFAQNLDYITSTSYEYDEASRPNFKGVGRYYNWHEANRICPNGWHLPSVAEWETLLDHFGGRGSASSKLKSTTDWEDGVGNNQSCFSAYPGGQGFWSSTGKDHYAFFGSAYASTSWWSTTEGNNDSTHVTINLRSYNNYVRDEHVFDLVPINCRCVED